MNETHAPTSVTPRLIAMKYNSRNLKELETSFPLSFPIKIFVEYRPGGELADYAPIFYTADPEPAVDDLVRTKGWDQRPDYQPLDVWVDGAF